MIPHQSTAALPQQAPAQPPASSAARPGASSLDLAPEPSLDLAPEPEPEPEIEIEIEHEAVEEVERKPGRPKKGKRGAGKSSKGRGVSGAQVECVFCFSQIPASAEACPSCGMDLPSAEAPLRGGRGRSRSRGRATRGGGRVQVFAALSEGISDFANNALFCCIALVIFQVATTVVGMIASFGGGIFAGMLGSLAGVVIAILGSVVFTLVFVTYLLQGLVAFWLACARDEQAGLGLLFSQPLAGALSGIAVQVVVTVAYLGLLFGIGFLANTVGGLGGLLLGGSLFFFFCCLLVLISGLAQIYIVDQGLGFGQALAAAGAAVTANAAKLLGYASLCLGAWFLVVVLLSVGLSVLGIAPDPAQPSFGQIILSALIQAGASLAFLSVLGTSLTRIYLQLSRR